MELLTIRLDDEELNVTPASVQVALYKVAILLLDEKERENHNALRSALKEVVRKAARLIGTFNLLLAADAVCLRLDSERGEGVGDIASDMIRGALASTGLHPHWGRRCRLQQERRGGPFLNASMEGDLREARVRPTRKFLDVPLKEVKRLADAGDADAKETMKQMSEIWPRMSAQIDWHVAALGVEETYRRMGFSFPSGALLDADEAAPADEAAA